MNPPASVARMDDEGFDAMGAVKTEFDAIVMSPNNAGKLGSKLFSILLYTFTELMRI
jgi:hypothetical protein